MTRTTNSQQLKIESSGIFYFHFIINTILIQVFNTYCSVWNIDIFRFDVDMIKKMLMHEIMITLIVFFCHWIIFIQIESDNIAKAKSFLFVETNQFFVYFYR